MHMPLPLTRDVVLIGGGHAHALVLRRWGMRPLPGARLTVINPDPVAPYTGMLPGHIAGHYTRADLMIDLVRLSRFAFARLILGRATAIDRQARTITVPGRPPVAYDVASIDVGIGSHLPDMPGQADHAVPAKPLGPYADRWDAYLADLATGRAAPHVVLIGAGIGGVELSLATAHRLRAEGHAAAQVTLIDRGDALPGIGKGARAALLAHLSRLGVTLLTNAAPVRITADAVYLEGGRTVPSAFVVTVAGARPQGWLATTGLDLTDGFVTVRPTLQTTTDDAIFAVGDCAHLAHAPRPKAGVFAVRQAPVLHANLVAALTGGPMRPFHPQRDYLKLVSTGGKGAVADKFGLRLDAAWLWRLKDRIDVKFMDQFATYPAMPAPALPAVVAKGLREAVMGTPPLCGGCGAKVGGDALRAGLATLPPPQRPDVIAGAGDDAAVLTHGDGVQALTTDHLRAVIDDTVTMTRIAALHALGDIWAMGAAPQAALAQITLPPMSPALQARTLAEILPTASAVFRAAGADLVGGHTTTGAEFTLGFTVTGLAPRPVTKGGARPGDVLILTRPLGSGVILAAAMANAPLPGALLGEVVAGALAQMTRAGGDAAARLAKQAHAMTDVTGFGLAGHLIEMLRASGCAATLDLACLPLLPGAEALAQSGVRSSLFAANHAAARGQMTDAASPRADLLHDPQTAGGFVAAVPAEGAEGVVAALCALGEPARIIGSVTHGAPLLTLI